MKRSVEDDLLESFEHHGRTVKIYRDLDAESPLTAYDQFSKLACWHRRLALGHKDARLPEPMSLAELRERVGDEILAALPLYIYDHGGVTMRTGPFSDSWDSGQVGWGYITKSQYEAMGCKPGEVSEADLHGYIRGEVETYDAYLTGQVYGYTVVGREGAVLDSCWGFYGGDLSYVRTEAKEQAESSEDPADERLAEELGERATFAGRTP